jgi:PAS domain S-box-containing protein
MESSQSGILLLTADGSITYANASACNILGVSQKEILNHNIINPLWKIKTFDGDDILYEDLPSSIVMRTGKPVADIQFSVETVTGKISYVSVNASPVFNTGGKIEYITEIIIDITKYKQSISALKESEEKYKTLQDNIPDGIFRTTPEGKYLTYNKAMLSITGYTAEEFTQIGPTGLYSEPEKRDLFLKELHEKGSVEHYKIKIKRKDGKMLWVVVSAQAITDEQGNILHIDGIARDIDRQVKMEEAFNDIEARYQGIVDAIPMGMHNYILVNDNLVFKGANKAADKILGIENSKLIGKTIEEAFPSIAQTEIPARYRDVVLNGDIWHTEQINYDDDQIKGVFEVFAFRSSPGQMSALFMDIAERKKSEDELIVSKERYRAVAESALVGIAITDNSDRITYVNPAFSDMLKEDSGSIIGSSLTKYFTDESIRIIEWQEKSPIDDKNIPSELQLIKSDGSNVTVLAANSPMELIDGRSKSSIWVFNDVTDKMKMIEDLNRAQRLDSIGILAGGIAHDFNNILLAIQANASMALLNVEEDSKIAKKLNDIEIAVDRARNLTRQLMTFSKAGEISKETVDLKQLIMDSSRLALSGTNVHGVYDMVEESMFVQVDKGQISQVINNIVINAVQAMPNGGEIYVKAEIYSSSPSDTLPDNKGEYIKISIQDYGKGIPEENLKKIFDPYFTTKKTGSGLGLATSYSIIKNHGGFITARSIECSG